MEDLGSDVVVKLNDEIDLDEIAFYDKIIISPGPGLPLETQNLIPVIEKYYATKPILGVCLGMQALGQFFGKNLINLNHVKHGVQEKCFHLSNSNLFQGIETEFEIGLYHSWAIESFEDESILKITSKSENNVIMSIEHQLLPIFGVQFHPESILTPEGKQILKNFLELS